MAEPTPFEVIMDRDAHVTGQIATGYLLGVRALGVDTMLMAPTADEVTRMAHTIAATLGGAVFGAEPRHAAMLGYAQLDFGVDVTEVSLEDWGRATTPVTPSPGT